MDDWIIGIQTILFIKKKSSTFIFFVIIVIIVVRCTLLVKMNLFALGHYATTQNGLLATTTCELQRFKVMVEAQGQAFLTRPQRPVTKGGLTHATDQTARVEHLFSILHLQTATTYQHFSTSGALALGHPLHFCNWNGRVNRWIKGTGFPSWRLLGLHLQNNKNTGNLFPVPNDLQRQFGGLIISDRALDQISRKEAS